MIAVLENKMEKYNSPNFNPVPSDYGCEILLERTSLEKAKDPSYPKDAYLVRYVVDNVEYLDLCRAGKRVNIFDLYYDKYGPDTLKSINWGYGKVNPKLWGYKPPSSKGKRK